MPNISSYTINKGALYYHALQALQEPQDASVAQERIRERLVTYIERRRAGLSLPPLSTERPTLGEKALTELTQMKLAKVQAGKVHLLPAGEEVLSFLAVGAGRNALRLILGRMIDTFDNVYGLVKRLSPDGGREIDLPVPGGTNLSPDALDDFDSDVREELDLAQACKTWADWCNENQRQDLLPVNFLSHAESLFEVSHDRKETVLRM